MLIKDCIFAMDEMMVFRLIQIGDPPEELPLSNREIMTELLGDDPEFNSVEEAEEVGLYYADLSITFTQYYWDIESDVDYELSNIRPIEICSPKNHSRKNLWKSLVQKFKSMKEFLNEKVGLSKES